MEYLQRRIEEQSKNGNGNNDKKQRPLDMNSINQQLNMNMLQGNQNILMPSSNTDSVYQSLAG